METANKKIGQSVQAGSAKDSFKFAVGMFYLLTNYLIVEIFLIAIRYFSYLIQSPPEAFEFHFMEAFSLLFGAGVVSYVVWMKNLTKEVANYKAQKKDKNIGGAIKSKISRMIKLRALFFAYLIWFLGEISFLIYSPAYNEWTTWFVIFGVVYFVVLTCILLFSRIFTHASAHEEKES